MDYPWWTIDAAGWGFREEDEIHCLACAEANQQALVRELTDTEIDEIGGVTCQICGKRWAPSAIVDDAPHDPAVTE